MDPFIAYRSKAHPLHTLGRGALQVLLDLGIATVFLALGLVVITINLFVEQAFDLFLAGKWGSATFTATYLYIPLLGFPAMGIMLRRRGLRGGKIIKTAARVAAAYFMTVWLGSAAFALVASHLPQR